MTKMYFVQLFFLFSYLWCRNGVRMGNFGVSWGENL